MTRQESQNDSTVSTAPAVAAATDVSSGAKAPERGGSGDNASGSNEPGVRPPRVAWVEALQAAQGIEVAATPVGTNPGTASDELASRRGDALRRFHRLGLPTPRDENWRWFPVGHLHKPQFQQRSSAPTLDAAAAAELAVTDLGGPRFVFVDGHFVPELTRAAPDGLTFLSLQQASKIKSVQAHLREIADDESNPFLALNDAFFADGAFLHTSSRYKDGAPVHLLFVSAGGDVPRVSHPRVLVQLDSGTQLHVVQEHVGVATGECLVNAVTEVHVGVGATLQFTKLTHDSPSTTHVATVAALQDRDSTFRSHSFTWGAGRVRNDVRVDLAAKGAHCELHGLINLSGEQIADDHTCVRHLRPHTSSVEHYKAVLDDRSRGAFAGAVLVTQDSQQTNSQQTSNNLLLSDHALMNTKPELQILADDVKCSHGATIGQLDPDALFYLRSRGLGLAEAVRILTHAFGRAVVDQLPLESLRVALTQQLFGGGDGNAQ